MRCPCLLLAALLCGLFCDDAPAADPVRLSKLKVDPAALAGLGSHRYTYRTRSKEEDKFERQGTWSCATKVADGKLILTDKVAVQHNGQPAGAEWTETWATSPLELLRLSVRDNGTDITHGYDLELENGRGTVTGLDEGDEPRDFALPGETVSGSLLMRLGPLLSREPGASIAFDAMLDPGHEREPGKDDIVLKCEGPIKETVDGKELTLTQYQLTGSVSKHTARLWFRKDGVLHRVRFGELVELELNDVEEE